MPEAGLPTATGAAFLAPAAAGAKGAQPAVAAGKPATGLAAGLNKGHIVTKRVKRERPSQRKGRQGERVKLVRGVVREVVGWAPYEKRIMEILKGGGNNPNKRAWRFAKLRLGTHSRAKRKVAEMNAVNAIVAQRAAAQAKLEGKKVEERKAKVVAKKGETVSKSQKAAAKKKAAAAASKGGAAAAPKGTDTKAADKPAAATPAADKPAAAAAAAPAKPAAAAAAKPAAAGGAKAKPAGGDDKKAAKPKGDDKKKR